MTEHSRAPWEIIETKNAHDDLNILDANDNTICVMPGWRNGFKAWQDMNARMISLSPKMLAALRKINSMHHFDTCPNISVDTLPCDCFKGIAVEIIAEVEGETT